MCSSDLCPKCGEKISLFGNGGGSESAARLSKLVGAEVPLIARIPFTPELREGGDNGNPIVISQPQSDASKAIQERQGYELMPEWQTKPANHYLPRSITETIAARTGLKTGTPVIAGVHDVHAAAIGVGAFEFGDVSLIFGTWSINQVFANTPKPDSRWHTHASIEKNRWLHMCTSPASASNANWFWELFGISELEELEKALKNAEKSLLSEDRAFFMPYLFGGPAGTTPGASLIGARGWHTKADVSATVIEGIVFNHKHHFDMLSEKVDTSGRIVATGGSMQSEVWAQLVADIFNREIEISDADESGARGLAMLVGVATGIYSSIDDAVLKCVKTSRIYKPNAERVTFFAERYQRYREHAKDLVGC